jgi:ribosomal protein S18 acetylase RimI-like enzyme
MEQLLIKQETLTDSLKKWIDEGFRQHAVETVGFDGAIQPIAFVAYAGNDFVGAVVCNFFWGALHVKYIVVSKEHRNKGLGKTLMEKALGCGKENGCPFAFVETMNFQALEFYKKQGFVLEFSRFGYSHSCSFHYLRKDL